MKIFSSKYSTLYIYEITFKILAMKKFINLFLILSVLTSCSMIDDLFGENETEEQITYIGIWSSVADIGNKTSTMRFIFTEHTFTYTELTEFNDGSESQMFSDSGHLIATDNQMTIEGEFLNTTLDYAINNDNLLLFEMESEAAFILQLEGTNDEWENDSTAHIGKWSSNIDVTQPFSGLIITETSFEGYWEGELTSRGTYSISGNDLTMIYSERYDFELDSMLTTDYSFTLPYYVTDNNFVLFAYFDSMNMVKIEE